MNGLLLEKLPPVSGREFFREDVGEFLEFYLRNFQVVFWSSCAHRNLRAMFQALRYVSSKNCMD